MFKKFIYICLIALIATSCNKKPEGFVINGTIDATANGKKVTLHKVNPQEQVTLDTTRIENGKLTLKGQVDYPDMYFISIEGNNAKFPLFIENTNMNITLYNDSLMASKVTGSKENDVFNQFKDNMKPLQAKNRELMGKFNEARQAKDEAAMTSIRKEFESFVQTVNNDNIEIAKANNNLVISASMLENLINSKSIKIKEANDLFQTFTGYVKNSPIGQRVNDAIQNELATAEGTVAPNFSAPNPEGKVISLNDIKGKATIIDFWAAWCGPCRKENPNVVKIYEKYHDKGLEIIGVSLDGTPRQKDAKAAWIEAIEKDGLTWHQVSNLNYFNDTIAKQYNIKAIPATFILDAEGKIVAKNLRGQALEDKIAELLN